MKALIKKAIGDGEMELIESQLPVVREEWVLIKVKACGICGTDLHIKKGEYPINPPVILGHEFSGEIVQVGNHVSTLNSGDRVVALTAIDTCGSCEYCRKGLMMLCKERRSIGSGINGAFADYLSVPASSVYSIPDNLSYEEAALTEPLACVVRCMSERTNIEAGDSVLISGPGTIGLLALQVARANGADVTVLGTAKDKDRLALSLKLGAEKTWITDHIPDDISISEKEFDVTVECAGVESSLTNCISLAKKSGKLIQVGLFGKNVSIDADLILMKELEMINGFGTTAASWHKSLTLLRTNKINVKDLISNQVALSNWVEGFDLAEKNIGFKTLLIPDNYK
ncbi:zinc-dependent alcohol dehydrogenase [Alkalicoccus saliphilus]|uniref:Zn-dependent alcohol dehydrogenase n=1 Tax=Alkalicoccus saliphilus TaxID=200989 RepID=A0A2T4U4P9_9BACI|nr:zinc-binding dehydrogenase [Alkalicoccus saliphilus]PTL38373.1 Zn-dependent alcohol dehydrogenase [Alkalicoccus saliphilus]